MTDNQSQSESKHTRPMQVIFPAHKKHTPCHIMQEVCKYFV